MTQEDFYKLVDECADAGIVFRVKRLDDGTVMWGKPHVMNGRQQPTQSLWNKINANKGDIAKYLVGITSMFDDVQSVGVSDNEVYTPPVGSSSDQMEAERPSDKVRAIN